MEAREKIFIVGLLALGTIFILFVCGSIEPREITDWYSAHYYIVKVRIMESRSNQSWQKREYTQALNLLAVCEINMQKAKRLASARDPDLRRLVENNIRVILEKRVLIELDDLDVKAAKLRHEYFYSYYQQNYQRALAMLAELNDHIKHIERKINANRKIISKKEFRRVNCALIGLKPYCRVHYYCISSAIFTEEAEQASEAREFELMSELFNRAEAYLLKALRYVPPNCKSLFQEVFNQIEVTRAKKIVALDKARRTREKRKKQVALERV